MKNPGIAALLAFIIPGSGFIYCEKLITGILAFIVWGFFLYAFVHSSFMGDSANAIAWLILAVLLWAGGIFGSYRTAKEINRKIDSPPKPNTKSTSL